MQKSLIASLIILFISSTAYGEKASEQSIRELMQSTGSGDLGVQVMNQLLPALKQMTPDAPEKFWQDFMDEVDANELLEMTIPIYQKYLTQEDIAILNEFYGSPTGKKMIKIQPSIMQESISVGQAWGQQLSQKVIETYKAQKEELAHVKEFECSNLYGEWKGTRFDKTLNSTINSTTTFKRDGTEEFIAEIISHNYEVGYHKELSSWTCDGKYYETHAGDDRGTQLDVTHRYKILTLSKDKFAYQVNQPECDKVFSDCDTNIVFEMNKTSP